MFAKGEQAGRVAGIVMCPKCTWQVVRLRQSAAFGNSRVGQLDHPGERIGSTGHSRASSQVNQPDLRRQQEATDEPQNDVD